MEYLINYGFSTIDIDEVKRSVDDKVYSELSLFCNMVGQNISFLKSLGISTYKQVFIKYPEIFLRDNESFKNVFSKFDKDDLVAKAEKNIAVVKKMVDFVDNN